MYRLLLLTALLIAIVQSVTWEDCSETKSMDAVTFTKIEVSPTEVSFPGDINLTLSMAIHENLTKMYLDLEIYRIIFGFALKIPCLNGTIVGSCDNIDACAIFRLILDDSQKQYHYGNQAEAIMNRTLGHFMECPLPAENVTIEDEVFHLGRIPGMVGFLVNGDYRITARAKKEINSTTHDIGCVKLSFTLNTGEANSGTVIG